MHFTRRKVSCAGEMRLCFAGGLAFTFSLGVLLQLLGCLLWHNWWPMLTAFMYVLVSWLPHPEHTCTLTHMHIHGVCRGCWLMGGCSLDWSMGGRCASQRNVRLMHHPCVHACRRSRCRTCSLAPAPTRQHMVAAHWKAGVSTCHVTAVQAACGGGPDPVLPQRGFSDACAKAAIKCRWIDAGKFLTGFSAVGSIAIPAILYHAEVSRSCRPYDFVIYPCSL